MKALLESMSPATIRFAATVATAVVVVLASALLEVRFRLAVRKAATRPGEPLPSLSPLALAIRERYVIRRSVRGFPGAPGPFPGLLAALGYPGRWLEAVRAGHNRSAVAKLLEHDPDAGLFDCFLSALAHADVGAAMLGWIEDHADGFPLRRVALSGPGRDFDGEAARRLLAGMLDQVREMLGDPEWAARAMAVRILSGDDSERSRKAIGDSLGDPHPLVRKLALRAPLAGDRLAFYAEAYGIFTRDPALEVRTAAKARIMAEFPDLYAPDMDKLDPEEIIHVLELLDPASGRDGEIAFRFLESGDPEQKLAAAEHLEARGALRPLLEGANPGDAKEFGRRLKLLSTAASYQVSGFLSAVDAIESDGAFEAAARVLAGGGDRRLVARLARRWFGRMGDAPHPSEKMTVYRAVLAAVKARGDADACKALAEELAARKDDPELTAALLDATDGSMDERVFESLAGLFSDPEFAMRDELRAALIKQPPELVVPLTMAYLRADRGGTPRVLRRDAVILAGELKLSWALQRTMETLPTLDAEEIRALAPIVTGPDAKAFKAKARFILDGVDAPSRAAIFSALPATGDRSFMADVKAGLGDADPDVRSAAVRALAEFQEDKALASGGMELLRDPVERVRIAAASALAAVGGASVVKKLGDVLADANEMDEVKSSLIAGLGRADDRASLDLIVAELGSRDEWAGELGAALSMRSSRKDLERILELFKDATGQAKSRIADSVRGMGKRGEDALVQLLAEDIVSLKPYIVEALESLGYVEARIRELKHRDPEVRRESAAALSLVGSRAAYRGIVLAARDPDQEVRVSVTRALERLAGPDGEAILSELENDPDARVRKYVLWAMERVRAKAL